MIALLRKLLWLVVIGGALVAGIAVAPQYQIPDRLLSLFSTISPSLPTSMSYEQFMAAVVVACVLIVIVVAMVTFVSLAWMHQEVARARHQEATQKSVIQQAVDRIKADVEQEYNRLIALSGTLTQRLDKHALIQNLLLAAKQVTSAPRADSAISLWVVDFETDHMRFELGIGCDETFFTQLEFEQSEPAFNRLLSGKQVLRVPTWQEGFPFVVPEKASKLGEAKALLMIPLVIERTVLGALVVFCHPDVFQGYDAQQSFYNAVWGQLSLALSIAIQGELAILDRLTGVVNRAYFGKRLTQEIDRSNRYQVALGVVMVDIDNFKAVNDTFGHPQGDAVLRIISKLIKKAVRTIDLVGRYGGEEFIVMLPETGLAEEPQGTSSGVMVVAERIRKAVEDEFQGMQKPLAVPLSVGVAVRRFPQDRQMTAQDLIRFADEQLYKAKKGGKNRCSLYVPPESEPVK